MTYLKKGGTAMQLAASQLVGLLVRGRSRAAEMEMFLFGPDVETTHARRGSRRGPRFSIHVQCSWRLVRRGRILVASGDSILAESSAVEGDIWAARDAALEEVLARDRDFVVSAAVSGLGDLILRFSDGSVLEIVIDRSRPESECFRITDRVGPHVVAMGGGAVVVSPRMPVVDAFSS
jgi:uncharacterized iron-regulated protein